MLLLGDFIYIIAITFTNYNIINVADLASSELEVCIFKNDTFAS